MKNEELKVTKSQSKFRYFSISAFQTYSHRSKSDQGTAEGHRTDFPLP